MKINIEKNLIKSWLDYVGSIKKWIIISLIVEVITMAFFVIQDPRIFKIDKDKIDIMTLIYFTIFFIIFWILTHMFNIGYIKCGLENSRGRALKISDVFFAFRVKPLKFLCLIISVSGLIFLWSLLFIIPGIIKSISYSQTFNLMVENPDYKIREAIKESKLLMNGYKLNFGLIIVAAVIMINIIGIIPIIGSIVITIMLLPILNLFFINFYNDITLYKYEDEYN